MPSWEVGHSNVLPLASCSVGRFCVSHILLLGWWRFVYLKFSNFKNREDFDFEESYSVQSVKDRRQALHCPPLYPTAFRALLPSSSLDIALRHIKQLSKLTECQHLEADRYYLLRDVSGHPMQLALGFIPIL
jgi:hypothetical protein